MFCVLIDKVLKCFQNLKQKGYLVLMQLHQWGEAKDLPSLRFLMQYCKNLTLLLNKTSSYTLGYIVHMLNRGFDACKANL